MTDEELQAQIATLQNQQSLQTQALIHELCGQWTGFPSAEADLYALSPELEGQLTLNPPVVA